jgi:hypothetical protein
VAEQKTLSQPSGATNKKLALIGVLAVVLIGILYAQYGTSFGGEGAEESSGALAIRRPTRPRSAKSVEQQSTAETQDGPSAEWLIKSVDQRPWKSPPLSDVVKYDPFALPAAFPQPMVVTDAGVVSPDGTVIAADATIDADKQAAALAKIESKLAELQQKGVRVIIQGRKQATAVIGDRTVQVGDDVDGFTVKAIQADGVVVERKLN